MQKLQLVTYDAFTLSFIRCWNEKEHGLLEGEHTKLKLYDVTEWGQVPLSEMS